MESADPNHSADKPTVKPVSRRQPLRTFFFPLPGTRNEKGEPLEAEVSYSWQEAEHDVGINAGPIIEGISVHGYGIDDFVDTICEMSDLRQKIEAAAPEPAEHPED